MVFGIVLQTRWTNPGISTRSVPDDLVISQFYEVHRQKQAFWAARIVPRA